MGTVFTVDTQSDDSAAVERVFDWWREVEARFSTFLPDSEISRIGRGELEADLSHPDVRHVLSRCVELEESTGGRFSMRPGRVGGPGLDPAGFVKGWSVDEASFMLQTDGIDDFMLYAGGDVLCSGSPAGGGQWRVGVRDPENPSEVVAAVELERGAVATSGTYERGDHVWGPAAGQSLASVTVIGPSLGTADALATAVFAAGGAGPFDWLGAFAGYAVLLIAPDGALATIGSLPDGVDLKA